MINYNWIIDNWFDEIWSTEESIDYLTKRMEEEIYTDIYNKFLKEGKLKKD